MTRFAVLYLWLSALTTRAWAQEEPGNDACPPGEVCGQVAFVGSWGLIVLGLLFFLVALLPYRGTGEAGEGHSFSLLTRLQMRIEKETTGWRRLQWPALGIFFITLGVATLLEWR